MLLPKINWVAFGHYQTDVLVAENAQKALESILWFFERFGWLSPSKEVIRRDQENLLKGRI